MSRPRNSALSSKLLLAVVAYTAISCFWIVASDKLLARLPLSAMAMTRLGTIKGLCFVAASVTLFFLTLQKLQQANARLEATVTARTTELTVSEQKLRKSGERLRTLLANLPDVTWTSTEDGRIVYISPNVESVLGYTAEEICENPEGLFAKIHPDDYQRVLDAFRALYSDGETFDVEHRIRCRDGRWIWVNGRAINTHEEGDVRYADGILSDITARKQAQEALRRYELLASHTRDIVLFMRQSDGRILEANAAALAAYGYSLDEMLRLSLFDLRACGTLASIVAQMAEAETHATLFETVHRRKNGSIFPVEASSQSAVIGGTRVMISVVRDITERKRASEALVKSEQYFRSLFENMLHGFAYCKVLFDDLGHPTDFVYLDVNRAFEALTGLENVVGKKLSEVVPGTNESDREFIEICGRVAATGSSEKFEIELKALGIWVSVSAYSLEPNHFVAVFDNITPHRQAEQALRATEERFRRVVEGAPEGIFIQNNGVIRYINPGGMAIFGALEPGEIVGQLIVDRVHPDDREMVLERMRISRDERRAVPLMDERYLRLDGTEIDVEVTAVPFNFEGIATTMVFFRDITERKREQREMRLLEQQLRQAQKMEALGRLASGVAHDFNNLLMVISSYAEILQQSFDGQDKLKRSTQEILKAAYRASGLTGQLLAFSRKQILTPAVLDLNTVVVDTTKMLTRLIGEDVEVMVQAAKPLRKIKADPDQIVQVLMNLCVNARDAMEHGGTLTITTKNLTVEKDHPDLPAYVIPRDYVVLSVADTGTGMTKDVQEQIFEPFFTTKGVGNGTGLGLATVYGIVNQSDGYVLVDSKLGQGSRFSVYLPAVSEADSVATAIKIERAPAGSETLLVVEDEDALRESICEFLCSLGYNILAANSGPQALALVSDKKIDLLVTDVVMPKMSGRELSQILEGLRPGLKTIYMSGYTDDAFLRHGISEKSVAFLQKPFSMAMLARKVREVIDPASISAS